MRAPAALLALLALALAAGARAQDAQNATADGQGPGAAASFHVPDLAACAQTSAELRAAASAVEPCVLYDETLRDGPAGAEEVLLLQITPANCADHRDGVLTAVRAINNESGFEVGYGDKTLVYFRLVSIIAGRSVLDPAYEAAHRALLASALETLDVVFIVGSCEAASAYEADTRSHILMAQVGPNAFFERFDNPYLFGMHVPSNEYTYDTIRQVSFATPRAKLAIAGRDRSEYYNSTCLAAAKYASSPGIGLEVSHFEQYNPEVDSNANGLQDGEDAAFAQQVAARMCDSGAQVYVLCISADVEADAMLDYWEANDCRPSAVWMTSTAWAWGLEKVNGRAQYLLGSAQWHRHFPYTDEFFPEGGAALQAHNARLFGYTPSYDTVASYTIPFVFMRHLQRVFADSDHPAVKDFIESDYERLRRLLESLTVETIYGLVAFDSMRRNVGRSAAVVQILPESHVVVSATAAATTAATASGLDGDASAKIAFEDACIAPSEAATASIEYPAPLARTCGAGQSKSGSRALTSGCFLCSKCFSCEANTYSTDGAACLACPATTTSAEASSVCIEVNDRTLSSSVRSLGYVFVAINWTLASGFAVWVFTHRKEPVVQLSQPFFLYLVAFGCAISSSTIIALSVDAPPDGDIAAANVACTLMPWLYCIGWTLSFSALFAKSWRLGKIVNNKRMRRIRITNSELLLSIFVVVSLDVVILSVWTAVDPLQWTRGETIRLTGIMQGVVLEISSGVCHSDHFAVFVSVLAVIHLSILIGGHVLLYKVRNVSAQFQERRYLLVVLYTSLQLLVLGVPLLFAVGDDPLARFLCLSSIVFLTDFAVLCLIFIPKIRSWERHRGKSAGEMADTIKKSGHSNSNEAVRSSLALEDQLERARALNEDLAKECRELRAQLSSNHVTPATSAGTALAQV